MIHNEILFTRISVVVICDRSKTAEHYVHGSKIDTETWMPCHSPVETKDWLHVSWVECWLPGAREGREEGRMGTHWPMDTMLPFY